VKRRIVDGMRELGGNCSGVGFWTTRASDVQSPSPVFRHAAAKMSSSGGRLFAHRNFIISGASRKILKIGHFCFGVAGKLGAKFAGPLIIIGKCRRKQAEESNCPKTRNDLVRLSRLISNICQRTLRRVPLRPINSEFARPLFLLMACCGVPIYAKTQISY
jgi:hypothetical protein